VGMAEGPAAGLTIVETLLHDEALRRYPWLYAVQGDLLEKLGRHHEAGDVYGRAAELAGNARERALLLARHRAVRDV
jgi:predicted RNA polymerase sigma factor